MTKHTPGPWAIDFWRSNATKVINIGPECKFGGSPILTVVASVPVAYDEYSKQESANAHLIAAAPDLLGACEKALIDLEDFRRHAHVSMELKCNMEGSYKAIKQAIAKAEGGKE